MLRALRRLVTELGLYGLDGVTGCRGLAGHRVTSDPMVPELTEPECSLHGP